mmetsp:Transcript_5665/g.11570  ORF Transcript_5665/g.11570 Transcript_5665/m.11570 type:complete len:495 (+) Transcript_5665:174-1658(+)
MTNPRDENEETSGDVVLIFEDVESDSDRDEDETFVFRRRGQSEEEPLQLDISLEKTHSCDDHTDETSDETSRGSSHQTHEEEELGLPAATESQQTSEKEEHNWFHDLMWLTICFVGIMASFVAYGILLEYATSGDRRLHELSFLFVTSVLATITAWVGRTVKRETITDIPANRFLVLGLMSIGSTFCAIRSLRYVIFPIQVLARSCKPVPVLLIGTLLGKKYPRRKYISVLLIVCGVAMFMGGGNILKGGDSGDSVDGGSSDSYDPTGSASSGSSNTSYSSAVDIDEEKDEIAPIHQQIFGVALLIASLFFDGGTGAYEDKLMSMHSVEPFDLMFKFQLSKALLSGLLLIAFNQLHLFVDMLHQTGIYIFALGMCSTIGQVFIFITIAKFGALTCSLMSLSRKVTTLTASIIIYDHDLTGVQLAGLLVALTAMLGNFIRPQKQPEENAQNTDEKAAARGEPGKIGKAGYSSLSTDTVDHESPDHCSRPIPVSAV